MLRVLMLGRRALSHDARGHPRPAVRNATGEMVPFGAFTTVEWTAGPPQLQRYNGYPAMTISGERRAGPARPARRWPKWRNSRPRCRRASASNGPASPTRSSSRRARSALLLGLSLVVVFLLLAALYESWSVPVAVLLVVPFGVLGAVLLSDDPRLSMPTSTSTSA